MAELQRKKLTLCYDGTNYHGWQVQQNAVTVQQTLQDALESVLGTRPAVTGCSRTDSGVHANRFCCHFDTASRIANDKLVDALCARLPRDIAALSCEDAAADFHARYSVMEKEYVYKIYNARIRNPFLEGYAYHVKYPLDAVLMDKAAKGFIGRHDFTAFCSAGSSVKDHVRQVSSFTVVRDGDVVLCTVCADGFLYNMVRIMVGTLLEVAAGRIEADSIPEIIASKDRSRAGVTAPALGLYLNRVQY